MKNKFFCVHAHFYQPPRQNPWTLVCSQEKQAFPYRDFNRKITDECYGPLSLPKVKNSLLDQYVSAYSHLSFNFGPTLLSWIEDHYPRLFTAIIEADMISKKIYGEGSAIAQAYNHRILPHCSHKDKILQIRWGMEYFEKKFKRKAKALWLPESAVDCETLEAIIAFGAEFAVLESSQGISKEGILKDSQSLEPYYFASSQNPGKKLALFFYNKELSHKITSEISDTEKYYLRIYSSFSADKDPQILSVASDGENYGHHLKNGDIYLASLLDKIIKDKKIALTNYASYLKLFKPQKEIKIAENTSWSCPHGLGRWEKNCGCRINPSFKKQEWREILKKFTDSLLKETENLYYEETKKILKDPQEILMSYWQCIDERRPSFILPFVKDKGFKPLSPKEVRKTLSALEMVKNAQFAATSCAWFFDDISSIEPINSLKFAMRSLEHAAFLGKDLTGLFEILKPVRSNVKNFDFEKIAEILKEEQKSVYRALFAFISKALLGFDVPFETHCGYRFKILIQKKEENTVFFQVSSGEIATLIKKEFFAKVKRINGNLIFSAKESPFSDFEKNIAKKEENFEICADISFLRDEDKSMAEIFLSEKEEDRKRAKFISACANAGWDFEKAFKAFEIIEKDEKPYALLESIPFSYDYLKHFLNLAAASKNREQKERIKKFILNSHFSKMIWKYAFITGDNYDNEKSISKK
ncbi:MAG: DUF3536 domain-containing protein [Elusimicrobiota bacterium]